MDDAVFMEVEKLRGATIGALRAKYREVFDEETRCRHRQHLIRRIAWRLQAIAEGDLSERARKRAAEIARDADFRLLAPRGFLSGERALKRNGRPPDPRLPMPGTMVTRQWRGVTVQVEVLWDGFLYQDRRYSSLSAIATAVTGTRWNGLAFFGLTRRKEEKHVRQ